MEILEKPYGTREDFASLDNIGFCLLEVNLDGEVYEYSIPGISEHCEVERVDNKWKIRAYDDSSNCIEYAIPRNVLVGWAWYNIKSPCGKIVSMPILSEDIKNSLVWNTQIKI